MSFMHTTRTKTTFLLLCAIRHLLSPHTTRYLVDNHLAAVECAATVVVSAPMTTAGFLPFL